MIKQDRQTDKKKPDRQSDRKQVQKKTKGYQFQSNKDSKKDLVKQERK